MARSNSGFDYALSMRFLSEINTPKTLWVTMLILREIHFVKGKYFSAFARSALHNKKN